MPEISLFYGIRVTMYYDDRNRKRSISSVERYSCFFRYLYSARHKIFMPLSVCYAPKFNTFYHNFNKRKKICKVSTKTLRYYAEIGLILPGEINPENGYRYYSIAQLETMLLIIRLKSYKISSKYDRKGFPLFKFDISHSSWYRLFSCSCNCFFISFLLHPYSSPLKVNDLLLKFKKIPLTLPLRQCVYFKKEKGGDYQCCRLASFQNFLLM